MSAKKARAARQAAGGFHAEPKTPTPMSERSMNARQARRATDDLIRLARKAKLNLKEY